MSRPIPTLFVVAALLAVSTMAWAQQPASSSLTISVKSVARDAGQVCIALFASKDGWPGENAKAVKQVCTAPKAGTAVFTFDSLPQGTYAAIAFHDEDADGKLKKNFIGMPKEGVGASNNAGGIGGPSFKSASFSLTEPKKSISFTLKYL